MSDLERERNTSLSLLSLSLVSVHWLLFSRFWSFFWWLDIGLSTMLESNANQISSKPNLYVLTPLEFFLNINYKNTQHNRYLNYTLIRGQIFFMRLDI